MVTIKNHYNTLGVSVGACDDEIKRAYRKLVKQYHPDLFGGEKVREDVFKQVNEAYDVLGDREKRTKYDDRLVAAMRIREQHINKNFEDNKSTYYRKVFESDEFKKNFKAHYNCSK